jgi:hypothetical protein
MRSGEVFVKLGKMGREDAKLLEKVFSHFTKQLRMKKPDDKLLEILNNHNIQQQQNESKLRVGITTADICFSVVASRESK